MAHTLRFRLTVLLYASLLALAGSAHAGSSSTVSVVIRNQQFDPAEVTVPAGKRLKLMVNNTDALPAEFESNDFRAEKVIPGRTELPVYVGPLKAGRYGFFNEFAEDATGTLVVK